MDHPTIGVYIDGACPGNGTPAAKGGIGVYFSRNSLYNLSAKVPADEPQTSQRAEWLRQSVPEQIETVNADERSFEVFIIVTDSQYLVKSITKDISRWKTNSGRKTSAWTDFKNKDLWEFLDSRLTILSNQEHDIDVVFWQVDRSETTEADRLANLAIAA
jgi:ribonuclease HI